MNLICILMLSIFASAASAQTYINIEGDLTWQSRNDQRVPGNSGTPFSLTDFTKGPFPAYRVYAGHIFNKRHEIRALYAPLALKASGTFSSSIHYAGSTFAPATDTEAFYKFNSYRLTYAYHFEAFGKWLLALGFSGKVRDAEVSLTQGSVRASKSNVGVVPLINFQALRPLGEKWSVRFDFDGLAAPQGRAFDVALFLERKLTPQFKVFTGYRTIEGGADNIEVYNFAWIHKFVLGMHGEF